MNRAADCDIMIIGGGMVGLLLARLIQQQRPAVDLRIAVVEPRPPAPREPGADLDLRVSALSPASLGLLQQVGALDALPAAARHPYEAMRVWQDGGGPHGEHALCFSAAETGVAALGSIVENRAVREVLWEQLAAEPMLQWIAQPAEQLRRTADTYAVRCGGRDWHTRLLVGADGARSWVRQELGVRSRARGYRQNALVAHLATEIPHADTAWQKFLPDGPVALLPLADGRSSLVWTHPQERTAELQNMSELDFAECLQQATDAVLGAFTCTTERRSFPLQRSHAEVYTGERFALLGDAAHQVHPLAGQGANLGFRDAAVLAAELGRHLQQRWADPGDPRMLRRYERRRKGDNVLTLGLMDGLNALFRSPLADVAGAGFGLVDRAGPLKRLLAEQAMGHNNLSGD